MGAGGALLELVLALVILRESLLGQVWVGLAGALTGLLYLDLMGSL